MVSRSSRPTIERGRRENQAPGPEARVRTAVLTPRPRGASVPDTAALPEERAALTPREETIFGNFTQAMLTPGD